jgi:hypothetical protein
VNTELKNPRLPAEDTADFEVIGTRGKLRAIQAYEYTLTMLSIEAQSYLAKPTSRLRRNTR